MTPQGWVRPTSDSESQDRQEGWAAWLRTMKWDWFVTVGYGPRAHGVTEERTKADTAEMLRALRATAPRAYAARVIEQGGHLRGWHAHVLVGGVGAHPRYGKAIEDIWSRYGPCHVVAYNPRLDRSEGGIMSGASAYIVKDLPHADLEIIGKPLRFRPRHK